MKVLTSFDQLLGVAREEKPKDGFAAIVANPPYQRLTGDGSSRHGHQDIYPFFQEIGLNLATFSSMVYPATWQKSITEGLGHLLMNSGLKSSTYHNGTTLFGTAIREGYPISIVLCEKNYMGEIKVNDLVISRDASEWIDTKEKAILLRATQNSKKMPNPFFVTKLSNAAESGISFQESQEGLLEPISILIKKEPGVQPDTKTFFAERKHIEPHVENVVSLDKFKTSMPSGVMGRMRMFHELLFSPKGNLGARVFAPGEIHGQTYFAVKMFDTKKEAENCAKYVNSRFYIQLVSLDFSKKSFASKVPDLEDYTDSNPDIEWSKPLDQQLYRLFNLTDEEIEIIEKVN